MRLLPGLEGAPSVYHSNCHPEKADKWSKIFEMWENTQQQNLDIEESFLFAQHTDPSALRLDWLQQINLTIVQHFWYAQIYEIVHSQTILTAANTSGCCATFSECSAYKSVCWQTAPHAGQTKILQETNLLLSIKIWVLGDRYWCSASRFVWVICDESSDEVDTIKK